MPLNSPRSCTSAVAGTVVLAVVLSLLASHPSAAAPRSGSPLAASAAPAPSATAPGIVTTVAGGTRPGPNAALDTAVAAAAVASFGNTVYVWDHVGAIRAIDLTTGIQRVVAGNGSEAISGDGGPAVAAGIGAPRSLAQPHLAVDATGRLHLNVLGWLRRIEANGTITTIAGNGSDSWTGDGGPALQASITNNTPAIDQSGRIFLIAGTRVRKIENGIITTAFGAPNPDQIDDGDGGPATAAHFLHIEQIAIDSAGNLIVLQQGGRLRRIGTDGIVRALGTVVKPDGTPPWYGGGPTMAADDRGNVLVSSDGGVQRIAVATGQATVIGGFGTAFADDVPATQTSLSADTLAAGPDGSVFVVGQGRVRRIGSDGFIHTIAGGVGADTYQATPNARPLPPTPAAQAQFGDPSQLALRPNGAIVVGDGKTIREVGADGVVRTIAGGGTSTGDGVPATAAALDVLDVAVARDGAIVFTNRDNRVRRIGPDGIVTTIAGIAMPRPPYLNTPVESTGDGGPALAATFPYLEGVAAAPNGDVFVSEGQSCRFFSAYYFCRGANHIRRIDTTGTVTALASGRPSLGGGAMAVDRASNLYFTAESYDVWPKAGNNIVMRRAPDGELTVVAGDGTFGAAPADGAPATSGAVVALWMAAGPNGELYLANYDGRVRTVAPDGTMRTIAAATSPWRGDGLPAIGGGFAVRALEATNDGRILIGDPAKRVLGFSLAPPAPATPAATAGDGQAFVSWTAPTSVAPIGGYTITASPGGQTVEVGVVTSTRVSGLTNGTAYTFTVAARAGGATGAASPPSAPVTPTVSAVGSRFHAVTPTRIFDTRDGTGGPRSPITAGSPRDLIAAPLTNPAIPATASALVMNVTAVGSTANSVITLFPAGYAQPVVSNLNVAAGQIIPNLVTVKIGSGNHIRIATQQGAVDVIADVVGWYDDGTGPGDAYVGVTPKRLLDSRTMATPGWPGTQLSAGAGRPLTVRGGTTGVPSTATTIIANVTATGSTANSFISVRPTGTPPGASNLNFATGQTIANLVTTAIGSDGTITLTTDQGATDLVVDLLGYYDPTATGGRFHPIAPIRAFDSRTGLGGHTTPWGPTPPEPARTLHIAGTNGIPAGAIGIVMNTTVTNGTTGSYLTVYPDGAPMPTASTLNFGTFQTLPNLTIQPLPTTGPATGKLRIANHLGHTDVIADVAGYFAPT